MIKSTFLQPLVGNGPYQTRCDNPSSVYDVNFEQR